MFLYYSVLPAVDCLEATHMLANKACEFGPLAVFNLGHVIVSVAYASHLQTRRAGPTDGECREDRHQHEEPATTMSNCEAIPQH